MILMKKNLRALPILIVILLLLVGNFVSSAKAAAIIQVDPRAASNSGIPGSVVTYELTVTSNDPTNTINVNVSAVSAGGWSAPVIVPSTFNLAPLKSRVIAINVPIPADATDGQNDIATVYFKDETSKTLNTAQLTTTAKEATVTGRPLVVITNYSTGSNSVYAGQEFGLTVSLRNKGQLSASNVVITFMGSEFYPTGSGGVQTVGHINAGDANSVTQNFIIGESLAWAGVASLTADISYTDPVGVEYQESFTLSISITPPNITGSSATATPNVPMRPQLVVIGYKTDVDPLQPGTLFNLKLDIKNLGMADAKTVTVVLGGGVAPGGEAGTPSGGVSGGAGDLVNFAPIGSSNLIYVGDITTSSVITVNQKLIVNTTTQPGAYSLKLSFVYDDTKGNRLVDDQVITLLVYSLPQVEVGFYRDAGIFSVGMENVLPLQVTNLGNKTSILGNMKVTAENADVLNNISLVGALDPGGYYTLDASLIPMQEGPMEIKVSINYTDDFNQPRFIEQVIPIEVQAAMEEPPIIEEGSNGGLPIEERSQRHFGQSWPGSSRDFSGLTAGSINLK